MSRYVGETPEDLRVIENAEMIAEHTHDYYDNRKLAAGITAAGMTLASLGLAEYLIENDAVVGSIMFKHGTLAVVGGLCVGVFQKFNFRHNIAQVK